MHIYGCVCVCVYLTHPFKDVIFSSEPGEKVQQLKTYIALHRT